MEHHPFKDRPVKIKSGKLTGRYFIVTDWLVTQFQGKSIDKIAKTHRDLTNPVASRGYALDAKYVIGKLYPEMKVVCVHDSEISDTESVDLNNVISLVTKRKEKEDYDTGRSSEGNNQATVTGSTRIADGRSLSGPTDAGSGTAKDQGQEQADSTIGSTAGRSVGRKTSTDERKASKRIRVERTTKGKGGK